MKEEWFNYVMANKSLWLPKFTLNRLEKVKEAVLSDPHIMSDLLSRHSGNEFTPEQLKEKDKFTYEHGISNFTCNILYKMRETGLIKFS